MHRMARSAEEMLYLAMEDFRIDIMVGKGAGATSIPLDLAPFTLVGATTRSGLLPNPLRDRFGFTAHLEYYEPHELERVVERSASMLGVRMPAAARAEIARRSRGTPRIANRLLRRVRDYALVHGAGAEADIETVDAALDLYDVDRIGLDRLDRAVLDALIRRFRGGPVGPQHPRSRRSARRPKPSSPWSSRISSASGSWGALHAAESPRRRRSRTWARASPSQSLGFDDL